MSTLYLGTSLDALAARFATLLDQSARAGDFFAPATVIVPNRYVGKWLRLWLARRDGIAINLHFGYLETHIWELLKQVDGRLPLKSACAIMAGREGIEKYIVPCPHGNAIVGCHNFSCHGLSKQPGSATRQDMKEQ